MRRQWLALATAVGLAACQWVPVTEEGAGVRVVSAGEVAGCKELATVTGQSAITVGPMARDEEKVEREVEALARNEAAKSGANAIVAKGPLDWDTRSYAAYRCDGW